MLTRSTLSFLFAAMLSLVPVSSMARVCVGSQVHLGPKVASGGCAIHLFVMEAGCNGLSGLYDVEQRVVLKYGDTRVAVTATKGTDAEAQAQFGCALDSVIYTEYILTPTSALPANTAVSALVIERDGTDERALEIFSDWGNVVTPDSDASCPAVAHPISETLSSECDDSEAGDSEAGGCSLAAAPSAAGCGMLTFAFLFFWLGRRRFRRQGLK